MQAIQIDPGVYQVAASPTTWMDDALVYIPVYALLFALMWALGYVAGLIHGSGMRLNRTKYATTWLVVACVCMFTVGLLH
nr:MAG TPA: YbgE [Caudoviricetes sp.]